MRRALQGPMPALVRLGPGAVDPELAVDGGHVRAWDVQVDRQQAGRANEQVIGEDGIDGTDTCSAAPDEGCSDRDVLLRHE